MYRVILLAVDNGMMTLIVATTTAPAPTDVIGWSEWLVGAPIAVVVVFFALAGWILLDKGKLVLGREYKSAIESRDKAEKEADELREQLSAYRDRVEAEILPAMIRTTDLVSRIAFREEERR